MIGIGLSHYAHKMLREKKKRQNLAKEKGRKIRYGYIYIFLQRYLEIMGCNSGMIS